MTPLSVSIIVISVYRSLRFERSLGRLVVVDELV